MPDPINLSNVNLTIRQFDNIASGKFNAGEVKLADANSLVKVNNHVTLTSKNRVSISHAEVIAIKEAFVKALAGHNVGAEGIAAVRRELGLAAAEGGVVDEAMRARSMKPLTRQQIRNIIDRHAETINARAGGTVGTSETIYANVAERTRQSRAASREQVNASLAGRRNVEENASIAMFGSIVGGDACFKNEDERDKLLGMAKTLRSEIMNLRFGKPSENARAVLRHTFGGGQTMTFDTGLSEAALVLRLDDVIARLRFGAAGETETSAKAHNRALAEALICKGADFKKFPYAFRVLADEVVSGLRRDFGADLVKRTARLGDLLDKSDADALANVNADDPVRVTPDSLRAGLFDKARGNLLEKLLDRRLAAMFADEGFNAPADVFREHLKTSQPELFTSLKACTDRSTADAVIDRYAETIKAQIHLRAVVERCRADVGRLGLESFAAATGIPPESLEGGKIDFGRLNREAEWLARQITDGEKVCGSDAEIESAFRKLVDGFVSDRASMLAKTDSSDLPPEVREALKRAILAIGHTHGMDFDRLLLQAAKLPVAGLKAAMVPGKSEAEVFGAIDEFCKSIQDAVKDIYHGTGEAGREEFTTVMAFAFGVLAGGDGELAAGLRAFFSRGHVADGEISDNCMLFRDVVLSYKLPTNAEIAISIGKSEWGPLEAKVFAKACEELGMGDLSADRKKSLLLAKEMTSDLPNAVRNHAGRVTLEALHGLIKVHLRTAAARHALERLIVTVAEENKVRLTEDDIAKAVSSVLTRDRNVIARILNGGNVLEEAEKQFNAQKKDITALVCAIGEIRAVADKAFTEASTAIAEETGLSREFLLEKLDINSMSLDASGSLRLMFKGLTDEFEKKNCDFSKLERDTVKKAAQAKLRKFIDSKVGQIKNVESLDVPDSVKDTLKLDVITAPAWKNPAIVNLVKKAFESPDVESALETFLATVTPESVDGMSDERMVDALAGIVGTIFDKVLVYEAELGEQGNLRDNDDFAMVSALINKIVIGVGGERFENAFERLFAAGRMNGLLECVRQKRGEANLVLMDAMTEATMEAEANNAENFNVENAPAVIEANKSAKNLEKCERMCADIIDVLYGRWFSPEDAEAIRGPSASPEQKARKELVIHALTMGYDPKEFGTLMALADLYRKATGCSFEEAEAAALNSSGDARRLYAYGGRFTASPENFAKGLGLIDSFKTWFDELECPRRDAEAVLEIDPDVPPAALEDRQSFEKFLFSEVAGNDDIDLADGDANTVFCVENIPAMGRLGFK